MVNKAILIGRLGKDPEVKYFDDGNVLANVSIATDESFKDRNGEKQERTEWHRVVFRRKQAEIAEKYLHKGDMVYVEGRIRTRSFEDKNDGSTKYVTEIQDARFTMLGSKGGGSNNSGQNYSENQAQNQGQSANVQDGATSDQSAQSADDDLPF